MPDGPESRQHRWSAAEESSGNSRERPGQPRETVDRPRRAQTGFHRAPPGGGAPRLRSASECWRAVGLHDSCPSSGLGLSGASAHGPADRRGSTAGRRAPRAPMDGAASRCKRASIGPRTPSGQLSPERRQSGTTIGRPAVLTTGSTSIMCDTPEQAVKSQRRTANEKRALKRVARPGCSGRPRPCFLVGEAGIESTQGVGGFHFGLRDSTRCDS